MENEYPRGERNSNKQRKKKEKGQIKTGQKTMRKRKTRHGSSSKSNRTKNERTTTFNNVPFSNGVVPLGLERFGHAFVLIQRVATTGIETGRLLHTTRKRKIVRERCMVV